MFSLVISICFDTSLIFLPICCLDLVDFDRMLESLWQSSDSEDESAEVGSLLFVLVGSFINFGGLSSSLLSSDADSNSDIY